MRGVVPGDTLRDRIDRLLRPGRRDDPDTLLNAFLARAVATVRRHFQGPLSYASGVWERVDWAPFDMVAVDCYRDAESRADFPRTVRAYPAHGKPAVATEFGCCTYVGARDRGGNAWTIVDRSTDPPRLDGVYERSEREQATEIGEILDVLDAEGFAGAFVFTFASYLNPRHPDPAYDLDMAAYGIVACQPDGSWRPKAAFHQVARRYRA
jgi:hypothetical protein